MAKKKKPERNDALNELKSLESKWLKDHRLHEVEPIQAKVMAAKVAALIDFIEQNNLDVRLNEWPPVGAEDLVKMDRPVFEQGLTNLQKAGVINSSLKLRKAPASTPVRETIDLESEGGILAYRCVKPGGINITDRDEYLAEDQEVTYTEDQIGESANLQNAIANEWLMRIETPANQ
jgi:hypothetical protein